MNSEKNRNVKEREGERDLKKMTHNLLLSKLYLFSNLSPKMIIYFLRTINFENKKIKFKFAIFFLGIKFFEYILQTITVQI